MMWAGFNTRTPKFRRDWAMPNGDTFSIPCIRGLVKRYLLHAMVSIDCFSRNKRWCTWTNDLNPDTQAEYHLEARDFLLMLREKNVRAEVGIFDPPYSLRQCAEIYKSVGKPVTQRDTQVFGKWTENKAILSELITENGVVISCGWNSQGMGVQNGFEIEEILLVCHGGGHNDTIVTVERKIPRTQQEMFTGENG